MSGKGKGKIDIVTKKPGGLELQNFLDWVLGQPENGNPAKDKSGERAAQNQGRFKAWHLAGWVGYQKDLTVTRTCTVPADQEIFVAAATSDYSDQEYFAYLRKKGMSPPFPTLTESDLKEIARKIAEKHTNIEITVSDGNGETFTFKTPNASPGKSGDLELVETPVFPFIFPAENVYKVPYGVEGGLTRILGVGWAIKFKLAPGNYTLTLKAEHDKTTVSVSLSTGPQTIDISEFRVNIQYNLTAIPGIKTLMFATP